MSNNPRFIDLTGARFGRLTVLGFEELAYEREASFRVRCDCGTEFVTLGKNLRRGLTRSCGCLRRDMMIERNRQRIQRYEYTGTAGV